MNAECERQSSQSKVWAGKGNLPNQRSPHGPQNNPTVDTLDISIPINCPGMISVSSPGVGSMRIRPHQRMEATELWIFLRSYVLPTAFGATYLPTAVPKEGEAHSLPGPASLQAMSMADVTDVGITANPRECTGMELTGTFVFAHPQGLVITGHVAPEQLPSNSGLYSGSQYFHKELHKHVRKPDALTPWPQNVEKFKVTVSWCVSSVGGKDSTANFEVKVAPNADDAQTHAIGNANIISLLESEYESVAERIGAFLKDKAGDSSSSYLSGLRQKLLRSGAAQNTAAWMAQTTLAGLDLQPNTDENSKLLMLSFARALNERVHFDSSSKTIAFRCFYYLLNPESGEDYVFWMRGLFAQVFDDFLAQKPFSDHKRNVIREFIKSREWEGNHLANDATCLQNDEITLTLKVRSEHTTRTVQHYLPPEPQRSWASYLHPVTIARGLGSLGTAAYAQMSAQGQRLLDAHRKTFSA